MLIAYWDIRNLRQNIDLVADLLNREEPDLLILQNIGNFDHSWTDPFTDYDDKRLFNSNTEPENRSTATQIYASRFHGGVLVLAKNDVLVRSPFYSNSGYYRQVTLDTTDRFNISVLNLPTYGYTQARHTLRRNAEDAYLAPLNPLREDTPFLTIGNFAITCSDLDIHPTLKRPRQPLVHAPTRARFNDWIASGLTDVYRAHNPSGGYYTAWRRSANGHIRAQNIGARTTMALVSPGLRERVTRCWHLDRYTRTHHCPIILYVRPYADPHGSVNPIIILSQAGPLPDPIEPPYDSGSTSLYTPVNTTVAMQVVINIALPPYEPGAPTYQWYKDDEIITEQPRLQNSFQRGYEVCTLLIDWAQESDSGVYTCVVQNAANSVTSEPILLIVASYPTSEPPWGGYQGDPGPLIDFNPYADPL